MSLMPMQKVAIFFPKSERKHMLSLLQDKGSVEILDLKETPLAEMLDVTEAGGGVDADRIATEIRRAIDDVSEFEERGGILSGLGGGKVMVSGEEFNRTPRDFDFKSVVGEVGDLEARRTELRTRRNHLEAFCERLKPWADLDAPLDEITARDDAVIVAGVLSGGRDPETVRSALEEGAETADLEVVSSSDRETHIIVFYHPDEDDTVREVLRKNDFEIHTFENLKGLPRDLIAGARSDIAGVDRELDDLARKGAELVKHKPRLMIAHDYFSEEAKRVSAESLVGSTETQIHTSLP